MRSLDTRLAAQAAAAVTVLVVDDNPDHRALIRMRLKSHGVVVKEASSGEEAIGMLDGTPLVLCDYQLPGMDGLQTLEAIRATSECSVVMLTGAGSETLVIDALRAGAADYLIKDAHFLTSLPLVVERAWRHHDLTLRAAELQRLSLLVSSAGTRNAMLGGIVQGARRLLRSDICILYLWRDDDVVEEASDGEEIREPGLLLARARSAHGQRPAPEPSPTRHLVVPMRFEDAAIGSLAFVTSVPRAYLPEEVDLAATFAAFAGIALSNLNRSELQQQLVERLQDLNDLRRDMIASLSHDLRTPLTCIIGFAGTLRERWDRLADDRRLEFVAQIHQHGYELNDRVNQLLDVAALESGRLVATPRPVNLADEINRAMRQLAPLLAEREVTVEVPSIRALADPVLLERAVSNLISNAVKFSAAGSEVTVRALARATTVRVDIIDRGVGMTTEEALRAFEPFWRSGSAVSSAARGSGVGLALVKEYLRVMGGDVTASSRPGLGSTFSMILPLDVAAPP